MAKHPHNWISAETRIQHINGLPNIEFLKWQDGYKNQTSKAVVKCKIDGYEWASSVNSLVMGSGCPNCSRKRRWTAYERIEQIGKIENIEFVRWAGCYKGINSKAVMRCSIDGYEWSTSIGNLIHSNSGCPQCAGNRRWTENERADQINKLDNIEFIGWNGLLRGKESRATVRCSVDGFEWDATVNDLINGGYGCPQCGGVRRWTPDERVEQINSINNIEFVRWCDNKKVARSRIVVKCKLDGFEWNTSVNALLNGGRGCPKCADYGYNKGKRGTLYALRSECGRHVKIGITNKPKQRETQLERQTPFKFNCIERITLEDGAKISDLERHFHRKYASSGFTGFSGATEWLICTDELLLELRNIRDSLRQSV